MTLIEDDEWGKKPSKLKKRTLYDSDDSQGSEDDEDQGLGIAQLKAKYKGQKPPRERKAAPASGKRKKARRTLVDRFARRRDPRLGMEDVLRGGKRVDSLNGPQATALRAAAKGGAMLVTGGEVRIAGSVLESNTASEGGGALFVEGGKVVLGNQTAMRGNDAPKSAGKAIYSAVELEYELPAPLATWVLQLLACRPGF